MAELLQKLAELQAQLAELERAGKRPAAPFARKTHPEHRKRPGRKAGQGKFAWRVPPPPRAGDRDQRSAAARLPRVRRALAGAQAPRAVRD